MTKALYLLFQWLYKHKNEWNIEEIYERFPIGLIWQKNHSLESTLKANATQMQIPNATIELKKTRDLNAPTHKVWIVTRN